MGIHAERDRRIAMAELTADVGDGRPGLQQQRCERVPHLVRPATMQLGLVQHLVKRLPHLGFVE
ncbi:MAG: hypothetical protein O3A25_04190 [Acidobacteria bacterium]|nr:hypothetical protein [Acidobacteriota bacterium]